MTRSFNFDLLLGQMQQDFETYYSLGYTPDRATDGKTHRIEVRLRKGDGRDKNWKVRHRERYRAKTRDERMTDNTLSALLLEVSDAQRRTTRSTKFRSWSKCRCRTWS